MVVSMEEPVYRIKVDILVNKFLELKNSELIRTYCALDRRFRHVALVLKNWMHIQSPKKTDRLNSYSVYILLLAYMIEKQLMPNLQTQPGLAPQNI